MSAGVIGYIIGGTLMSLLVPMLILIAAKFIPSWKRDHKAVYIVCALLVVLACAVVAAGAAGAGEWPAAAISASLALLFLWWGYRRGARALAPPPSSRVPRKGTDY
jgi:hypothetical protein